MPWFIKTEYFTKETVPIPKSKRSTYIREHKKWVDDLIASGVKIFSGYLLDSNQTPGGGGLLIVYARNFNEAEEIILRDPMILSGLVKWNIHEWRIISGDFP